MVSYYDRVFRAFFELLRSWNGGWLQVCRKTSVLRHSGMDVVHMAAGDTTACSTPTQINCQWAQIN